MSRATSPKPAISSTSSLGKLVSYLKVRHGVEHLGEPPVQIQKVAIRKLVPSVWRRVMSRHRQERGGRISRQLQYDDFPRFVLARKTNIRPLAEYSCPILRESLLTCAILAMSASRMAFSIEPGLDLCRSFSRLMRSSKETYLVARRETRQETARYDKTRHGQGRKASSVAMLIEHHTVGISSEKTNERDRPRRSDPSWWHVPSSVVPNYTTACARLCRMVQIEISCAYSRHSGLVESVRQS